MTSSTFENSDYYPSDEQLRNIRKTTKRYKISIVITTNDSAIDTRIGSPIWSVLDKNREILESVSLPFILPSYNPD